MPPTNPITRTSAKRTLRPSTGTPLLLILIASALIAGCSNSTPTTVDISAATAADTSIQDPQVRDALATACFDCHSEQGNVAWNARLAPTYLFGKSAALNSLNFSKWGDYSAQKQKAELAQISKAVADGQMPPGDYELLHPAAKLSAADKSLVLEWAAGPPTSAH